MYRFYFRFLPVLFLLVLAITKANSQTEPPGTTTLKTEKGQPIGSSLSTTIGPEGGELAAPDGSIKIVVPAGCVAEETEFKIQPITNTVTKNGSSRSSFRLLPEGENFKIPVQVVFQYEEEDIKRTSEDLLTVRFQREDGSWETVPASLNKNEKTITIETTHFSDWVVAGSFYLSVHDDILAPGQSTTVYVQNINDPNSKQEVDDLGLAPLVSTPEKDKWTGSVSFIGEWKSLNGFGKVSPVAGVAAPIESRIKYTASTLSSKGKVLKGIVTVRIKGNVVIPGLKQTFKEFILRAEIPIISDDYYLYGTFGGKEIFYTEVQAIQGLGVTGKQKDDVINMSIQSESGQTTGIFSSGNMAPDEEDESGTAFDFKSGGEPYHYKTEYLQCVMGGHIIYPGFVMIYKWGKVGEPVKGTFSGTLYHLIEEKDRKEDKKKDGTPKGCPQYLSETLKVEFKAKREM